MNWKYLAVLILTIMGISGCSSTEPVEPAASSIIESTAASSQIPTTAESSPTMEPTLDLPTLPVIGPAPDFQNDVWINSDKALRLEDLQGKVVLLEFWTFG